MSEQPIRVVVAMNVADDIIQLLRAVSPRLHVERYAKGVTDEVWKQAEVLYTSNIFPTVAQAPNLRWIALNSAGMDHAIGQPIVAETEVMLTSASGIHAVPMTEFTIGMMLAWEYRFRNMFEEQQQGVWRESQHNFYAPRQLRGLTMGIVGYGAIGRELARVASALGMSVLATKRDVMHPADHDSYTEPNTGDPEGDIPERLYPPEALASMAKLCDYLVLLTPLTEQTRHMLNADVLSGMRPQSVVVNLARGGVIDEQALIEALRKGVIGGAILDVFSEEPLPKFSPLWTLPNVIISPHVAGNSNRYEERSAALMAENLKRYLERRELLNLYHRQRGY